MRFVNTVACFFLLFAILAADAADEVDYPDDVDNPDEVDYPDAADIADAADTDDGEKKNCCYPDKLSGDVMTEYKSKMWSFEMDFANKKILKNYEGTSLGRKLRYKYVLFDLDAAKRYRMMTDDTCKWYGLDMRIYGQCVPDDAEVKSLPGDPELVVYTFKSGTMNVEMVMTPDTCHPVNKTTWIDDKSRGNIYVYGNVEEEMDVSVFDSVDISKCT